MEYVQNGNYLIYRYTYDKNTQMTNPFPIRPHTITAEYKVPMR